MIKTIEQINQEFIQNNLLQYPEVKTDIDGYDPELNMSLRELSEYRKKINASLHENQKKPTESKNSRQIFKQISNIAFYAVIAIVASLLIWSVKSDNGFNIFGYSGFTVLTESMQSEIPKGSLVIVKNTPPDSIKTGDDISFFKDENTVVTHKVVNIIENYNNTGTRGFQTKGIENADSDAHIVTSDEIIGVVCKVIPNLGYVLSWISANILIIILIFIAVCTVFIIIKTNRKLIITKLAKM